RANLRSWLYVGLAVVAVVVLVYFWSYPARKRRRDGSLALSHASGGVQSAAEQCADEAGIRPRPTFMWNPFDGHSTAQAYGRPGQYEVVLADGLVSHFHADLTMFRAIVFHELGHLRNADVTLTYLSVGMWFAFRAVVLVPLTLVLLTFLRSGNV